VNLRDRLSEIAFRGRLSFDELAEEHAERAAIREYLGGMPRDEAEDAAVGDACEVFGVPHLASPASKPAPTRARRSRK
jgi:hypothetical protein